MTASGCLACFTAAIVPAQTMQGESPSATMPAAGRSVAFPPSLASVHCHLIDPQCEQLVNQLGDVDLDRPFVREPKTFRPHESGTE